LTVPLVLSPTILGFYLLVTFGARSPIGQAFQALVGHSLPFSFQGLLLASAIANIPFVVQPIQRGFEAIPSDVRDAAACCGLTPWQQFLRIELPLAWPGVLTASIDSGIAVKSIWDMISGQVFDFALPTNSTIKSVTDLKGKKIALGSAGWSTIVDPILVGAGVDPKPVHYVNAGNQWAQATESGQADAGLAWEGLRAQWAGQGLKLKYLIGTQFSKQPSNVYSVRASDLSDSGKVDLYTRFLQGMIMGLEFAKANPRAAAQITYTSRPALQKSLKPQAAYDSFLELAEAYGTSHRAGQGWGFHSPAGWAGYLSIVHKLGQTKKMLSPSDVYTNDLVKAANSKADKATAIKDAKAFKLSSTFQAVNPGHPNI